MSELKAVHAFDVYEAYTKTGDDDVAKVYLKSEADKVIAELTKKLDLYKRGFKEDDKTNAYLYVELRHQKYKRCLAMARWCFTKSNYHFVLARHGEDAKENNRRSVLYSKWHKRWLAIAEKFKGGV